MMKIGGTNIWVGGHKCRNRKWGRIFNCTRNIEDLEGVSAMRVPISFREPIGCLESIQMFIRELASNFLGAADEGETEGEDKAQRKTANGGRAIEEGSA